jgi:D-alanyl-D-alanine carboxypeptidase/D-alanyl-D-alanine-endopeptidase (penicillin-binding protein 4)
VDDSGLYVADGSGLSRMNNVTPRLLADVLTRVATRFPDDQRKLFEAALPEGGTDGTLRSRFKNTFAQGRVHAKTGTLGGASSLSGYVVTKAGERLVFSILMNNYDRRGGASKARAAQDAVVLAACDVPAPSVAARTVIVR